MNSELYDPGDVIGLDETWILISTRVEMNWRLFALHEKFLALARAAEKTNVEQQVTEEACEDVEEIAPIKKRTRQCYSASQLEILKRELENCITWKKNADIVTEISGLDGAREVTTQDVKNCFCNMQCRSRRSAA